MFTFTGINWIAVLVGIVFSNALGFLWYGPFFGAPWMRGLGRSREDMQGGNPLMYVTTALSSLVTMVVLAAAVRAFGSTGVVQGALLGLILYIGIAGTATYVAVTFEGRSRLVWWINGAYNLVVFAVMGAVFAIW